MHTLRAWRIASQADMRALRSAGAAEQIEVLSPERRRHVGPETRLLPRRGAQLHLRAATPALPEAAASAEGEVDLEVDLDLKRQLAERGLASTLRLTEALESLRAVEELLRKRETQWRLTSLKRHAETNKLEQALKVSHENGALLERKVGALELSLLSHQKSMERGRAEMMQAQLRERNGQLEHQHELSDIHANGATAGARPVPPSPLTPSPRWRSPQHSPHVHAHAPTRQAP